MALGTNASVGAFGAGGAVTAEAVGEVLGDALAGDGVAEGVVDALGLAAPAVPSSGLVLDFDADDLSGSDGDPIGTWDGGDHNATAAGSARPTLLTAARGIGGRQALLFDGTDDVLAIAHDAALDLAELTVYLVAQGVTDASGVATSAWLITRLHASDGSSPYARWGIYVPASGTAVRADGNEHTAGSMIGDAAWERATVWSLSVGAAGTLLHAAGRRQIAAATTSVTYPSAAAIGIGGRPSDTPGEWWRGKIARVLIYSGQHTATERQAVEGALAARYGLTLASSSV